MVTYKKRMKKSNEKRSLIPWGLRVLIWKIPHSLLTKLSLTELNLIDAGNYFRR